MNESILINSITNDFLNGDFSFAIETLLMLSSFVYFWYTIFTSSGQRGLSHFSDSGLLLSKKNDSRISRKAVLNKAYALNRFSKQRLYVGMKQYQKSNLEAFHAKNESLRVGSIL